MRPRGEVRLVLLSAAPPLSSPPEVPGATLRDLAATGKVGLAAAKTAIANMTRAGDLCITGRRKVAHRSRPVAEYKRRPGVEEQSSERPPEALLAEALRSWKQKP